MDVKQLRLENERLRILIDFVSRPIHAYGGSEPDPDIISAYNLAVESALQAIRRMAASVANEPKSDGV
jgi:hypothetical protein